ncbi:MAG: 50S ribosomal protein L11 methyltransferase [Chthonomonadetes bacterium]|nr:50S ribosomal protein L11 methyltransferase [Chthonomonadetes bacterium]
MRWLEFVITVPAESHEAVAEICRQAGSQGVRLEADGVVAYLPITGETEERKRFLRERLSHLPEWGLPPVQAVDEREVDDTEWAESWKRFFHVQRVGTRVVIKPSWQEYEPQEGEVVVELDPGMAFGTGQHASTQLCIEFLEELVQEGATVVDVGTGSGILAIVAAKLGAGQVWAGDNDPVAVLTAQRNVARNGVEGVVSVHLAEGCEGTPECDLLVANITAEVIEGLLPDFARCVRRGGFLVVSGIVKERSERIRVLLSRAPWGEVTMREQGEWCAFCARRG